MITTDGASTAFYYYYYYYVDPYLQHWKISITGPVMCNLIIAPAAAFTGNTFKRSPITFILQFGITIIDGVEKQAMATKCPN